MSGAQSDDSKSIADKPREKFSMPQKPAEATGIKHAVNPGKSTMERVENLSKFEELYKMLSAIKRRMEMDFFAIPPQIYIRSDLEKEEKQNLLDEDKNLMNSLSLDDHFWINNSFISKSVIREAEKVFLENRETFLWVEVFNNNMYLAVTRSTGNRKNPFEWEYFHYDRTYELNDDVTNSDIFNGIGVSIQAYLTNGYIQTEFDDQNSIPIIFCFSDFHDSNSPIEQIATRVWDRSTFKGEIVGKNYSREIARALQLIDSKKKIEFTTITSLHNGNFLSYYCFETFDEDKRPAANYNFLGGLSVQEFIDCKQIKGYKLKETNLTKIYPDSVTQGKDSKTVIVSNSYFRIGQNDEFERSVIYKFLTQNERNFFDENTKEVRYLFSRIASPFKVAQLLQTYIRNHPLFLNNEKLEEKPIVDLKRFDYFLQTEYKDHGSILHPFTFELIGKEINNFAKFIMKRCLSFSALALLSAIERKYYTQIEPKYSAGCSPIVRICMREDDRGLAKTFEDSIVEYLNNGAEIFWTQRRKDLKAPTFELVSAFDSMFSGSHVYTKYLRTLIPRDYWDEAEDESNREELKERKRKYKIAWDARVKEIEKFNELAKQAMNNIATMESSEQIDFSKPSDKEDLKSTLEKMFGFGDIGKIEAVYITPGPISVNKSQTKAETISRENNRS
ncbi:MAG: hypothetical protein MHMPM18_005159 [Marteilia pararefringens]